MCEQSMTIKNVFAHIIQTKYNQQLIHEFDIKFVQKRTPNGHSTVSLRTQRTLFRRG